MRMGLQRREAHSRQEQERASSAGSARRVRSRRQLGGEMKYLAAYMLLSLGGKGEIAAADVEALLGAAGVEVDAEALATMMAKVEGKDVAALIASGQGKLLAMGGGGAAPAAGGAAPAAGGKAAAKKEEEKKEEPAEVDLGGGGLFGGAAAAY